MKPALSVTRTRIQVIGQRLRICGLRVHRFLQSTLGHVTVFGIGHVDSPAVRMASMVRPE
jgi:hypothetical protein